MFKKPSSQIALEQNNEETEEEQMPVEQASSDKIETVVGPSVTVEGDFASEGDIVVKGTVSGNVKTSQLLTVEEGAKIFANVKAGSAIVAGAIKGNVKVAETLELTSSAQVGGDIDCKTLIVAGGALLRGKITMKGFDVDQFKPEKKISLGRPKTKKKASKTE
ncbi:MAG: hypothetical protein GF349_00440 [Candidatus Magasanikbacteria bacterium]|nr:hypothetical protein [Candidatus Magasanikbacteria bacterium]